ncbi:hypothetical protein Pelo_7647 [Pelomyxa schiedti]|nr:hypothetical protein Pelo_7647 [Pelomyxa schiedti]
MGISAGKPQVSPIEPATTPTAVPSTPTTGATAKPKEVKPLDYVVASRFVKEHTNACDTYHEKLAKSLVAVREQLIPVNYFGRYESLQKQLSDMMMIPEESALMPPEDQESVRRACSKEEPVRIATYGPTGVGKTSLINSLCGQHILQVQNGHCTARVCVLKYADPENACIRSAKVVDGHIVTGEVLESLTNLTPPETVSGKLFPHLDRSAMLQGVENEETMRDILTTIIVVEYPVPLLKAGIELVDLPGHAISDSLGAIIFPFIALVLRHYRPHGVVFCFATAKFGKQDEGALTTLKEVIAEASKGLSVDDYTPDIFFANTHFDFDDIAEELNGDPNLITEAAILRIYDRHLKKMLQSPATRSFTIPDDFQKCMSFCCVSAHDLMCNKPSSKFTHGLFMDKFLHWIIAAEQKRCCTALEQIGRASGTFFRNLTALCTCSCEDIQKMRKTAEERIHCTEERLLADITQCTQQLPFILKEEIQSVRDHFLRTALSLPFEYDPSSRVSKTQQAETYLTQNLIHWLKVNVIHPVITKVRIQIQKCIEENLQQLDTTEDVRDLLWNAGPNYVATMRRHALAAMVGLTCLSICATLATLLLAPVTGGGSLLIFGLGTSVTASLGTLGASLYPEINYTVDDEFKKDLALRMLDSLCEREKVEAQRVKLETMARGRATEFIAQRMLRVSDLCKQRLTMINACPEDKITALGKWSTMRRKFGKLIARIRASEDMMLHDNPVLLPPCSSLTSSPCAALEGNCTREGIWNDTTVYVKVVDLPMRNESGQREFFEDLHHWHQMTQCSQHVLPLKMVFRQQPNLWCVVYPRFTYSLKEHMERHISTMRLEDALVIAREIIGTIKDLHQGSIVHSNLRLETIVVTVEGNKVTDVAVAGFSTITEDGSCSEAANRLFCTPKVDIFAFGVILSELTPKPTLRRCLATTAGVAPQLPTARGTPPQLVNLINQCVATDPDVRPTARLLFEALSSMCQSPIEMVPGEKD